MRVVALDELVKVIKRERPLKRHRGALWLAAVLVLTMTSPASAQYFGRNKVQYKAFTFQILKTDHFDVYFYPSERAGALIAARLAERWYARLSRLFAHELSSRQPLILYASQTDFQQTNVIPGELGEGTGGVTEPRRRRIVLPLAGSLKDTDHVIGHELTHAFQFDLTQTTPSTNRRRARNRVEYLPLWFIEGMAEYVTLGPVDSNTAMWLRDAARREQLPSINDLRNPKYFPYRWGQALWAYIGGRWGDQAVRDLLIAGGRAGDVNVTFQQVLRTDTKQLSADWHAAIRQTYEPVLRSTDNGRSVGRMVIGPTDFGGRLNISPALSPDGRWIAFLSERSFFAVDLYVANARTGQIVHKLTSMATDPHTSSLQFIYSAGAWSADSRQIAIATVREGRPAIAIFNADTGEKRRELTLASLDEVLNPTWAPDGHAVCFTGFKAGLADLYVYDFASLALKQLTNDPYTDLQPAWSPDGSRIAFVTDRFTTRLETLDLGEYRLAVIDPKTGTVTEMPTAVAGKNINPQWSSDGGSLYFVADRAGISDVYRLEEAKGEVTQMTNVSTGVSGITPSSPALSVAGEPEVVVFTVYGDDKYEIHALEPSAARLTMASTNAAVLPPVNRDSSEVVALLNNLADGLPAEGQAFPTTPFQPRLELEGVGQPMLTVGASRYGTTIGGGAALYFSDMLGDRTLSTVFQPNLALAGNYSVKNTVAQVAYLNQQHRWNYGFVAGQIPYLSAAWGSEPATMDGERIRIDQTIIYRQTERSMAGVAAYPLNRAQRIEVVASATQTSFDRIVQTQATSLETRKLLVNDSQETSLEPSLMAASLSTALVHDTANFGATSPIQGERYRFEFTPTVGSAKFVALLADYRRYVMPARFYTLAGRLLHAGRYGSGAEDPRLFPLFVGYPNLVRGYYGNAFSVADCVFTASGQCPAFDRLAGSRELIGNLELRFPLLRPFGVSQQMYGPLPTEVAVFADAGVAWRGGERPAVLGGTRRGVSSLGVTLRTNFGGVLVAQFTVARPFQLPGEGWLFQFSLGPGF